jgi:hypothetical protein
MRMARRRIEGDAPLLNRVVAPSPAMPMGGTRRGIE